MLAPIANGVVSSPFPTTEVPDRSVPELVREGLNKFANKVIAVDNGGRLTGGELLEKIEKFAVGFQRMGMGPGCYVCALINNTVENLAAVLAVIFTGATLMFAKPTLVTRELLYQIKDAGCNYLITDERNSPKALEVSDQFHLKGLFSLGSVPNFTDVRDFLGNEPRPSFELVTPKTTEDVFALLYTSGTTAEPKGVEVSHRAFSAAVPIFRTAMLFSEEDVSLAWNPLTHLSGFVYTTLSLLAGGLTVFREPNSPPYELLETIIKHEVSSVAAFPLALQPILNEVKRTGRRVTSIKRVGLSGGTPPKSIFEDIRSCLNCECAVHAYGLTETLGPIAVTLPGQDLADCVGFPLPGCRIKIVEAATGNALGPLEHGEIWAQSKTMMIGYHGKPEETAAAFSDGWLRTGDVGYYDEKGQFYFVERMKSMIKCMNNQVAPAELESILLGHEAVQEVAVIGTPNPEYGEAPTACVVLKITCSTPQHVIAKELKQLVEGQTAVFKHLFGGVFFFDSLPRSETGKVLRQVLLSGVKAKTPP